ncbi:hydroxyacid dehydrogenase [Microaerobacter geothermalis]|uniref:hydroxyacid dehydrogenase n=1 Tax=Microaerobacter geothermalis TaxID=674972 RepID=UPI001F18811F|nr:hydroxyacid dehydrogenase [Microaerobacter geothermalis]MCF6094859.1 hydroxyacid dehydrogenase [Microaerobacter geothermalis]
MKILQILSMYHLDGEKILHEHAEVIKTNQYDQEHIISLLLKHKDIKGIILRAPARITSEIIEAASSVKVISGAGVGLDNIEVDSATKKGIAVLHAPKVNTKSTAEHAVGLFFSLYKKILPFDRETRKGNFLIRDQLFSHDLLNKELGLVGWGSIARHVAKICSLGLGMNVRSYVRRVDDEKISAANKLGVRLITNLSEIFSHSDIISVHLPLTEETRGLINRKYFSLMKPSAYFVNTARGAVVNETDLIEALSNRQIAGAGLDVFSEEPPSPNHPLFKLDNVVISPHIGGITEESARLSSTVIANNVIRFLNGEKPQHIANPEVINMV